MSQIDYRVDARGVARLVLNNPARHNAFDDGMIGELTAALQSAAADSRVRLLVLAAAGKSFSAGADLNWMRRMAGYSREENLRDARALAEMLRCLNGFSRPTIAQVQGAAFGGAVGLVCCCDLAVGTERASFCLSEVKIGLIPATIAPYVIAAMGARAARRYFATAERFDAATAQRLGVLSEVVEAEALEATVEGLADRLLANGPAAVSAAKKLVLDLAGRAVDAELIEDSCRRIADIRVSAEGQEGLGAFLEKRAPAWIEQGN
ncbi:MAG: enoyl-CoA hydratase/isomerase family protein [Cellvibrionales bacterium]|nr:enoyl-CoA hydratase/isomerase family protein [Cellvibrionales bacterium]